MVKLPLIFTHFIPVTSFLFYSPRIIAPYTTRNLGTKFDMSTFSGDNDGRGTQINDESMSMKSWLERIEVSIAKSRKIKGGNYVQISSIDEEGKPACRTVVFRGFHKYLSEGKLAMKMITDMRSDKYKHFSSNPYCEMVWWFSQSSEQYRISGKIEFITEDETDPELITIRKQQWGNLSDPAREQFFWNQPGIEYSGAVEVPKGGRDEEEKVLPAPKDFLIMLLVPEKVKYLRLKDNYAQLDELRVLDEVDVDLKGQTVKTNNSMGWISQRVNP